MDLQGLKVKIFDFQNLSALTKTTEQKHRNSKPNFCLAIVAGGCSTGVSS